MRLVSSVGSELARIDVVVFDRIARPQNPRPLQPRNRGNDRPLHILRQRGRNAVGIDRVVVKSFRLQENLVAVALAEAHDLVLDATDNSAGRGCGFPLNTSANDRCLPV